MLLLYLSNEIMSLVIQLSTILLIVIYSITYLNKNKAMKFGAYSMLLANLLGQLVVAGEGPVFFLGIIVLPFWGIMIAYLTVTMTNKKENCTHVE